MRATVLQVRPCVSVCVQGCLWRTMHYHFHVPSWSSTLSASDSASLDSPFCAPVSLLSCLKVQSLRHLVPSPSPIFPCRCTRDEMIMAWCRQNPFNHAFFCSCTEDDLGPWSESNRQERQRSLLSPFTYYQGGVSPQTTHRVTKSGTRLQRLGTQSINKGRKIQEDSRHEVSSSYYILGKQS